MRSPERLAVRCAGRPLATVAPGPPAPGLIGLVVLRRPARVAPPVIRSPALRQPRSPAYCCVPTTYPTSRAHPEAGTHDSTAPRPVPRPRRAAAPGRPAVDGAARRLVRRAADAEGRPDRQRALADRARWRSAPRRPSRWSTTSTASRSATTTSSTAPRARRSWRRPSWPSCRRTSPSLTARPRAGPRRVGAAAWRCTRTRTSRSSRCRCRTWTPRTCSRSAGGSRRCATRAC